MALSPPSPLPRTDQHHDEQPRSGDAAPSIAPPPSPSAPIASPMEMADADIDGMEGEAAAPASASAPGPIDLGTLDKNVSGGPSRPLFSATSGPVSPSLPSIPPAAGHRPSRYGYGSQESQTSLDSGYGGDYEDGPLARNMMRDLRGVAVGVHGAAAVVSSPTGGSASRCIGSYPLEPRPLAPYLSRDRLFQQSLHYDEAVRASYAATSAQPFVGASSSRSNRNVRVHEKTREIHTHMCHLWFCPVARAVRNSYL